MMKFVRYFRSLSFKEKTVLSALISIYINFFLAIGKLILGFFAGGFFISSAIVNALIMASKLQCYLGERYPEKKCFNYRNKMIGIYLILAGVQYALYMARLIFLDVKLMDYNMFLGICVATVSFIEIGIAIKGCFNSYGKGHYYRNIKLISLCSAMTAIVLTEIAIMSFASTIDYRFLSGIFGVSVGLIIILVAIFILIAPKVSIIDREHNVYKMDRSIHNNESDIIEIQLTNSKFYGSYKYIGKVENGVVDGHITQGRNPIFRWNIYILIFVIVLSEILIFPYAVGAIVYYFKNANLIKKLDAIMIEKGYQKVEVNDLC